MIPLCHDITKGVEKMPYHDDIQRTAVLLIELLLSKHHLFSLDPHLLSGKLKLS